MFVYSHCVVVRDNFARLCLHVLFDVKFDLNIVKNIVRTKLQIMIGLPTLTVSGKLRPLIEPVIGICVIITMILATDIIRDPASGEEYNFVKQSGMTAFWGSCLQWYDVVLNSKM